MDSGSIDPEMDLTKSGTALGTVSYISPEQALGEAIDTRTDIFSLGAVLYEMVTGRQAFGGNTQAAIFNRLLNQPPTSPARMGMKLPFELERIISTALEKDPKLRFQSAEEFGAAMRRLKRDTESGQSVPGMAAVSREEVASMVDAEQALQESESSAGMAPAQPMSDSGSTEVAIQPVRYDTPVELEAEAEKNQRWMGVLAAGLIVALAAVLYLWVLKPAQPLLSETDVLLLTDFVNQTGDSVFDGTLKQALAVKLEESPYLKLAPDRLVDETLTFMGLDEGAAVTEEIGQDICQRQGIKALVTGGITSLGASYVVTLSALECVSGETLAREQVQASSKEEVLAAVGEGATSLRRKLGESLSSVQKFDAPVEQATTSSLEALKSYSLGNEKRKQGLEAEAIPHFRNAIELDPDFAVAHARLGTVYVNLKEWDKGVAQKQKAFDLVDRVSELERFYITSHYHSDVTGDVDRQIETFDLWKDTYPRDWIPHNNLAELLGDLGRFDEALVEARATLELESNEANAYVTLARALIHQGAFDEAQALVDEAFGRNLRHHELYQDAFQMAFIRGDEVAMRTSLEALADSPGEAWLLHEAAGAAASRGQMTESRRFLSRAVEVSQRFGFEAQVAYLLAEGARREAAFGFTEEARELVLSALDVSRNRDSLVGAAIAMAVAGATDEALQLISELGAQYINDLQIQEASIPIATAAVVLREGDPLGAVEMLSRVAPFEKNYPLAIYLRGVAYLAANDAAAASGEFAKLDGLSGVDATRVVHTLAPLGRARAFDMSGLADASRAEYEKFFALLEHSDPGLPILREARAEFEAIR
jgi:tetratricopeptide (TPR) repeat protein